MKMSKKRPQLVKKTTRYNEHMPKIHRERGGGREGGAGQKGDPVGAKVRQSKMASPACCVLPPLCQWGKATD